jgi:hypothetical protein
MTYNVGNIYRIHHIRPRFKNDAEGVLLFVANEVCNIGRTSTKEFDSKLDDAIKMYPPNYTKTDKTIANWRTEISALFGLFQYEGGDKMPSKLCEMLSRNQDLIEFFRYFLYYFQYPGGHLKPQESLNMIRQGIRFHPTSYLLKVLLLGREKTQNNFGITKAEATHLIFNNLDVATGNQSPKETVEIIIRNRSSPVDYDTAGDTVRYAGDILDYMELADLVELKPNYQYYPRMQYLETFNAYINADAMFPAYESLYTKENLCINDIKNLQSEWFDFINSNLNEELFKSDISSMILSDGVEDANDNSIIKRSLKILSDKKEKNGVLKTKEIGDIGEAIILNHEKCRIKGLDRDDLIHLIKKIPEQFGVGFDIKSFLGDGDDFRNIHVEVKTTVSKGKLSSYSFHMTPNEWQAADSYQDLYFVYRLMISYGNVKLFIIRNPVSAYKNDLIKMTPRDGASIKYTEKSGEWAEVLS